MADATVHPGGSEGFGVGRQRLGGSLNGSSVCVVADGAQAEHTGVDHRALLRVQQVTIGIQRTLGGHQHPVGIYPRLSQRTCGDVLRSGGKTVLQHTCNVVVGQAIRGFNVDVRLDPTALLPCRNTQQSIGVDGEGDPDTRRTGGHRRNTTQLETGKAAAVGHQVAFALHYVESQSSLAILVGSEVLRHRGGDGLVARHDTFNQAAHGFDAERQRNHVEQQDVVVGRVACQLLRLNRRAQSHDFVRVQVVQWLLAKESGNGTLHLRHTGGASDHHHPFDLVLGQLGVTQGLAHGRDGAGGQVFRGGIKVAGFNIKSGLSARHTCAECYGIHSSQRFLASTGRNPHGGLVGCTFSGQTQLPQHPGPQSGIVVVAAQGRVATGSHHFKHTLCETQDRNVKRTATQVEHGVESFAAVVQAVGDGRGRGFVQQAQQVQAGQLGRVLGGLALGIVEVRGHGDDGTKDVVVERVFRPEAQGGQNFSADLHRGLRAPHGVYLHHTGGALHKAVRQVAALRDVLQAPAHQPFGGANGVFGVERDGRQCIKTDLAPVVFHVTHNGWQNHPALCVGQALGYAIAYSRDQGMGRAQVDTHGNAPLVRVR